jgi:hypothetical protein
MNKLFAVIMKKEDVYSAAPFQAKSDSKEEQSSNEFKYRTLKRKVFHLFKRKVLKNLMKIEESIASQAGLSEIGIKREYVCFIVKAFMESFQALHRMQAG